MRRRDLLMAAAGAVVASVLAGGIAWAATIPGAGGVIQGCYDSGGNVKVVAALPCPKGYTALQWNEQGVPGAPGVSPTVAQLAPGDVNCPTGGAAITDAVSNIAYVCNGADGQDGSPFSGTFTSPNGQYAISVGDTGITLSRGQPVITIAGTSLTLKSGGDTKLETGSNFELKASGTASLQSSGALSLKGSTVDVNGGPGCARAARLGDGVQVNPDTGTGMITAGEPTVCIGG